jgi:hypothetical protein
METTMTVKEEIPIGGWKRVSVYFPAKRYATLQRIPDSQRSKLLGELFDEWADSPKGQALLKLWDSQAEQLAAIEASE